MLNPAPSLIPQEELAPREKLPPAQLAYLPGDPAGLSPEQPLSYLTNCINQAANHRHHE
jgi:hypothetical protein